MMTALSVRECATSARVVGTWPRCVVAAPIPRRDVDVRRRVVRRLESEESSSELEDFLGLVTEVGEINRLHQPPIKVPVRGDSVQVQMELDTGASVSIVSENQYKQIWPGRSLDKSTIRLQTYSKEPLIVVGSLVVQVE